MYRFRKHHLAEFNVVDCKYRRQHQVGSLHKVQEERDSGCGTGVVVIGLGTGVQSESEFSVIGSSDGG